MDAPIPLFSRRLVAAVSLALATLAGLCAWGPTAQADAPRYEISAFGGYRIGGEFDVEDSQAGGSRGVDLEDGGSWGVGLGLYRDPAAFYEFLFSTQTTQLDRLDPALGRVDITTEYYHIGGTLLFEEDPVLKTYLTLTAGVTRFKADGFSAETELSASLGGGLRVPLGEQVVLTLGVRGYLTLVDSDTGFFCSSIDGQGTCLVRTSGSSVFQGEATAGIALRF